MFLIIDNKEILNMDNIVSIYVEEYTENKLKLIIVSIALHHNFSEYYDLYRKKFIIEKKKWFELLEAIQNDKKFFLLQAEQYIREHFKNNNPLTEDEKNEIFEASISIR